jgi:hypothetical protein
MKEKKLLKYPGVKASKIHLRQKISFWYLNLKIAKKLIVAFITIAVLSSALIGTVGVINIVRINSMSSSIYHENLVPLTPLYKISTDFLSLQTELRDLAIGKNQTSFNNMYLPATGYGEAVATLQQVCLFKAGAGLS